VLCCNRGLLFVTTANGALTAIDLRTGEQKWVLQTDEFVKNTPRLARGERHALPVTPANGDSNNRAMVALADEDSIEQATRVVDRMSRFSDHDFDLPKWLNDAPDPIDDDSLEYIHHPLQLRFCQTFAHSVHMI
jgi:hypothetical protein